MKLESSLKMLTNITEFIRASNPRVLTIWLSVPFIAAAYIVFTLPHESSDNNNYWSDNFEVQTQPDNDLVIGKKGLDSEETILPRDNSSAVRNNRGTTDGTLSKDSTKGFYIIATTVAFAGLLAALVRLRASQTKTITEPLESTRAERPTTSEDEFSHPIYLQTKQAVCVLSSSQRIVHANPAYYELTGYTAAELVGRSLASIFPKEFLELEQDALVSAQFFDGVEREAWGYKKYGEPYRKTFRLFYDDRSDRNYHAFYVEQDISKTHQQIELLEQLAKTDPLTGLFNRRKFDSDICRLPSSKKQVIGLCAIGIDNMRKINQEHGTEAGDSVLIEAGRRLSEVVKATKNTLYRLDSDEFLILLKDVQSRENMQRQNKILLSSLAGNYSIQETAIALDAHIGATLFSCHNKNDIAKYLAVCHQALRDAKRSGLTKSKIVTTDEQSCFQQKLTSDISSLLKSKNFAACLKMSYQPQVNVQDAKICGAQANLCWQYADTGHLTETELIDTAKQSAILSKLEQWMINRVLEDTRKFSDQIDGFQTTIRLSENWISDPILASELIQRIKDKKLPPGSIAIDISKRSLLNPNTETIQVATKMRAQGIEIHAHGAATSLGRNERFDIGLIDAIKIDKSYLEGDFNLKAIEKLFSIAKAAGVPVIAEGVDNSYQLDLLTKMGCKICQGHIYSEPVFIDTKEDPSAVLSNWQKMAGSLV